MMTKEEAITRLQEMLVWARGNDLLVINMAIEALKEQRPAGHWEEVSNMWGDALWRCDRCGVEWIYECTPEEYGVYYCPHCGTKMEA